MKTKRIHIILATTLFALFLWISVKLGDVYNATLTIPLSLENVPPGLAPRTLVPPFIRMRVRGEGWQLAGVFLGKEYRCVVNLQSVAHYQTALTLNDVVARLDMSPGVQPLGIEPDSIHLGFDSLASKKIPVVADYSVSFKDHYGQVGPVAIMPDSVLVSGARSLLETIDLWPTVHQSLENLKDPVNISIPLLTSGVHALTFSPANVNMRIDVQWFAEKVFAGVPVEATSVPPHRDVILVPPKIEVVVRGGVNQLSTISLADFRSYVDYGVLLSDTTGTITPEIIPPPGVQIVSRRPDKLQYVIRRRL